MKSIKLFLMSIAAMSFAFTSCEEKPTEPEVPPQDELGTEARMTSLTLVSGDVSVSAYVSGNTMEVAYKANEYELLQNATAEVVISDGATIEPDPATPRDYTVEGGVTFTVTSEDGNTENTYTVTLIEASPVITATATWEKTVGELGLPTYSRGNVGIAFSGNNIVTYDTQVFDLTGSPVGKLNLTGVEGASDSNFQLASLTNDANGVLVATVGLDASGAYVASGPTQTRFYAWMDGYDQAPTLIHSDDAYDFSVYMSVAGDVKGDAVLTFCAGRDATQMHHVYGVTGGDWTNKTWSTVTMQYPGNDGNWGQGLTFLSGDPEGAFVMYDSRGDNQGLQICYYENGVETRLSGTLEGEYGGSDLYGNYSQGSAKAFMIDGVPYVAVASSGWVSTYLTVQPTNTEDEVILPTVTLGGAEVFPSVGVYYDSEAGNAYVAMLSPNSQVVLYTISVQYV